MRITVLRRGGLSVYGGSYDAKRNVAMCDTANDQTVVIIFPDAITAASIQSGGGFNAGTIAVSGTKASFTLSGTGSLTVVATMGDDRPSVTIEAETCGRQHYGTPD